MANHEGSVSISDSRLDRELIHLDEEEYEKQQKVVDEANAANGTTRQHSCDTNSSGGSRFASRDVSALGGLESGDRDRVVDQNTPPADIRELTIKNLDTGEEFIIGENDPDFEFDTFELRGDEYDSSDEDKDNNDKNGKNNKNGSGSKGKQDSNGKEVSRSSQQKSVIDAYAETLGDSNSMEGKIRSQSQKGQKQKQKKRSLWTRFLAFISIFDESDSKAKAKDSSKPNNNNTNNNSNNSNSSSNNVNHTYNPRTPFTKLSSFKFRKELGRGAFGRVLLAEAKTDGTLYVLSRADFARMRHGKLSSPTQGGDILLFSIFCTTCSHCVLLSALTYALSPAKIITPHTSHYTPHITSTGTLSRLSPRRTCERPIDDRQKRRGRRGSRGYKGSYSLELLVRLLL